LAVLIYIDIHRYTRLMEVNIDTAGCVDPSDAKERRLRMTVEWEKQTDRGKH